MGGAPRLLRAPRALQTVYNPQLMHRNRRVTHSGKTPLPGGFYYRRPVLYAWRNLVHTWYRRAVWWLFAGAVLYALLTR